MRNHLRIVPGDKGRPSVLQGQRPDKIQQPDEDWEHRERVVEAVLVIVAIGLISIAAALFLGGR